jgi:Protein of unknown function (DUF3712)
VSGIALPPKEVTLRGFNGLKNSVHVTSFDLPANDPAGGIHLTLETTVTNVRLILLFFHHPLIPYLQPSQVGVQLEGISFNNFFQGVFIGPVTSAGGVTLSPGVTSPLSLVGRLVPQSTPQGLAAVSALFNNVVAGKDSVVSVHGAGVEPDVSFIHSCYTITVLMNLS